MTDHLMIEGTKRYRNGQTGQEYRFEWMQFWEATHAAAEGSSIHKVEARLAEAAHISKEAVHDHLLRGYGGALLCGMMGGIMKMAQIR